MTNRLRIHQQPFVHMVVLGSLLWVGLHVARPSEHNDRHLEVTDEVVQDLRNIALAQRDREPTEEELGEAVQEWVTTEILVRESVERGLSLDDPLVRSHLARKMLFVLQASEVADEPTEQELRSLYEQTLPYWQLDERWTVRQVFVPHGPEAHTEALRLLALAQSGADGPSVSAQYPPPAEGPLLRGRQPERLAELWSTQTVDALREAAVSEWLLVPEDAGWRLVRLEEREPGRTLPFEQVRERLRVRWQNDRIQQAADQQLQVLRAQWTVTGWPP